MTSPLRQGLSMASNLLFLEGGQRKSRRDRGLAEDRLPGVVEGREGFGEVIGAFALLLCGREVYITTALVKRVEVEPHHIPLAEKETRMAIHPSLLGRGFSSCEGDVCVRCHSISLPKRSKEGGHHGIFPSRLEKLGSVSQGKGVVIIFTCSSSFLWTGRGGGDHGHISPSSSGKGNGWWSWPYMTFFPWEGEGVVVVMTIYYNTLLRML